MAGSPRVGILALQGDVREHENVLQGLGAATLRVRRAEELALVKGLVIPGGESTVIDKLSRQFGLQQPLREAIAGGLPVYGTCAGLILLADTVIDGIDGQQTFGGMDISVRRNAFGRQTESFEAELAVPVLGDEPVHATFIRAPIVERAGDGVEVLAALPDGAVVAVQQGNLLGTSFHPEVGGDARFHAHFLTLVTASAAAAA
ncbi:pyridoxal 5'-phosphate synthase glutaminase subunit PdxT [Microbacterium abyssi]|uniref:pyridoxal 5'-phosphate synthase glutaminase subunit PdxT n=1 Tax=Microbacterium abyssi TaxID=2782166 RepID=UPI001889556A|nr:pyridoxal 5'-phosphate synthase glutaminase subunit PdxT [Microbacterium sp. A18JL241]